MPSGESVSTWSCDDGFQVRILPRNGRAIEFTARELGADSLQAEDQKNGDPTTIDVQSMWLSIDEAVDLATMLAEKLNMPRGQIEDWRQDAQDLPDDSLDTKTRFIHGSAGEVKADLQVIHQSVSGNNNVHLILYLPRHRPSST